MSASFEPALALPSVETNASSPLPPQTFQQMKPDKDFTCYVRNKGGIDADADAPPSRQVKVTKAELVNLFHLSLSAACREVGLCSTTFKKACRAHGLRKWPYHRSKQSVGGEAAVSVDATKTTGTVSQSVDKFCRSNAEFPAKAASPRHGDTPFAFPEDNDFAETSMARPDLLSFSDEDFNTAAPSRASSFPSCSKTAPTSPSSSEHVQHASIGDSLMGDEAFWTQPVDAYTLPPQWDQPSPISGMGGFVATHSPMPPAPHDAVPMDLLMVPAPRCINYHTTSVAFWTPAAPSRDSIGAMPTEPAAALASHDTRWTMHAQTAAAQDSVSWATWGGVQRAPSVLSAEGSFVDALEACLSLPLDRDFVLDFGRQD